MAKTTRILPDYDLEMKTMEEKPLLKTIARRCNAKQKIKRKIAKEKAKNNIIKTPGGVYKTQKHF